MCLDNRAADGQAHAHPGCLARLKRIKNLVHHVRLYTGSIIGHGYLDRTIIQLTCFNNDLAINGICSLHGLNTVPDQVDHYLFDLHLVNIDMATLTLKMILQFYCCILQLVAEDIV